MLKALTKTLFGSRNDRLLKAYQQVVSKINDLEPTYTQLTDDQLAQKTPAFKARLEQGETLNDILPEAFATVRETAKRILNMRHFDVQLIGGMNLHHGKIAEMHTGEGKTLVATLPAYLNALTGKGVHVVTVNDYLAQRDADWMRPIYAFLGLTVGTILTPMKKATRIEGYQCDITYGTNNEFGFDYLRDNMALSLTDRVQRPLNFAIVDEVDSILIDEARTPLIISGPSDDNAALYQQINTLIPQLTKQKDEESPGDYHVDEKSRQVFLSEKGQENIENILIEAKLLKEDEGLYHIQNMHLLHHLSAALKAHALFTRDVDYIVRDNEVIIVDEHTGRTMVGRRWSEGIHQAVEAKENVKIQQENQTLASITFQNYFRLYDKLSGMTGTADTEAYEFQQIYNLEVVVIPTNKPNQRIDSPDLIFLTQKEKFMAVIENIKEARNNSQPVLVGTASIEASEILSTLLNQSGIAHKVLNAKFHEKEADIIADAGRPGTVTIATNMAGRGTDIVLGGNLKAEIENIDNPTEDKINKIKADWQERHNTVLKAGGLHVIGSERHESRRIDNQLRGRCARQGDPGSSVFFLSLEDTLMRIFAPPTLKNVMQRLGMQEGEAIRSSLVTRAIENAQRKVEGHNFDIRKQLLEYDDVANEQRKFIYRWRDDIMRDENTSDLINDIIQESINSQLALYIPPQSLEEQWDIHTLQKLLKDNYHAPFAIDQWLKEDDTLNDDTLRQKILSELIHTYHQKIQHASPEVLNAFVKAILLQVLDYFWKEHLATMDQLRDGIHLRGYAQKDPKQEYKREAFALFAAMLDSIKAEVTSVLFTFQLQSEEDIAAIESKRREQNSLAVHYEHDPVSTFDNSLDPQPDKATDARPKRQTTHSRKKKKKEKRKKRKTS